MHVKANNSERSKPTRFPSSHNTRHAESRPSASETDHHSTSQLPNVNSFIHQHSFKAELSSDGHQLHALETNHLDCQEIALDAGDRKPHFLTADQRYNVGESDCNKTSNLEQHREEKTHTDRPDNYPNTRKTHTDRPDNYPNTRKTHTDRPGNYPNTRKTHTGRPDNYPNTRNTTNKKTFCRAQPSEGHPQTTAFTPSEMSDQKIGEACSEHQANFGNHPQTHSSVNHTEALPLASQQSEKLVDAESRARGQSPGEDAYDNDESAWEQENDRFVHYTWRNDGYGQNSFVCDSSGDDGHANTLLKRTGFTNSMMIGSHFPQTYLGDGSCGSMGLSHRRRRRRVQTPVQRSAANMRERRRMCHLNVAFDRLKEHLPNIKHKQKLSRIQTLKAAIDYINLLQESLSLC